MGEALCLGCQNLLKNSIKPLLNITNISSLVDIDFLPFGYSFEMQNNNSYDYHCHHGFEECQAHFIFNCAINKIGKKTNKLEAIKFIICVEEGYQENSDFEESASKCAGRMAVDYGGIEECVKGKEGIEIMHEIAMETGKKMAKIQFLPYVEINGKYFDSQLFRDNSLV